MNCTNIGCNEEIYYKEKYCCTCGRRINHQRSKLEVFTIVSFGILGVYYLIQAFLLHFISGQLSSSNELNFYPLILLPILSGGLILATRGLINYHPGARPFGLFFIILQFVEIVMFSLMTSHYLSIETTNFPPFLLFHTVLLSSKLVIILRLVIFSFQIQHLQKFEGKSQIQHWKINSELTLSTNF